MEYLFMRRDIYHKLNMGQLVDLKNGSRYCHSSIYFSFKSPAMWKHVSDCLLYTSDAADE